MGCLGEEVKVKKTRGELGRNEGGKIGSGLKQLALCMVISLLNPFP